MADVKKYYYMRLKENFFDSEEMVVLESMQDGMLYSNILIKMYLKSLKANGMLMFKDTIPYNPTMIATITRHQVGTVEKALQLFEQLGLIEVLDNGAIYMNDIELFIGKTSTEGERKKAARLKIEQQKKGIFIEEGQMSGQMSDKCTPELELEKEKELDNKKIIVQDELERDFEDFWNYYPKKTAKKAAFASYKKARKNKNTHEKIMEGLFLYLQQIKIKGTSKDFIAQATTYLNQERFNDEYDLLPQQRNNYQQPQTFRFSEAVQEHQTNKWGIEG